MKRILNITQNNDHVLTVISVQRESLEGLAVWMKLELKQIL